MRGMPGLDTYNWEVPWTCPAIFDQQNTLNSKFLLQRSGGIITGKTSDICFFEFVLKYFTVRMCQAHATGNITFFFDCGEGVWERLQQHDTSLI